MPIRRLRRALLISVTVLSMLLALPAATVARAHKSSCHATTAHVKHGERRCARPAHKAKPKKHRRAHSRHKHKHKHKAHAPADIEEAEDEAACEEGAVEAASSDESGAVCEASEEEQED